MIQPNPDANASARQLLKAKALGFTISIAKMAKDERISNPSESFGRDYNGLRSAISQTFPDLAPFLPPNANLTHGFTAESYGEILTWCEQLYQLLEIGGRSSC